MVSRKRKVKRKINIKKVIFFIAVLLIIVLGIVFGVSKLLNSSSNKPENKVINTKKYTYIKYGSTNNKTNIYIKNNNKFDNIGSIEKGIKLEFSEIDKNYLKINGFDNQYYIKAENINKEDAIDEIDNRYKNYIVFNENVVTNDKTSFYNEDGNLLYTINNSYDLPIIVKDNDRYGVEFNNRLVYVNKNDVKETKNNNNTNKTNASGVGVLNYHFFYDDSIANNDGCNEDICISKSQFTSELEYLKNNNIFPIMSKELEWYIDGKIQLPKSVYITIDDGARTKIAVDLLKEYKYYATIFLVTSWFDPNNYYTNEYIELHSHTDNMHNQGDCPTGQGGGIQCLDKNKILSDLQKSQDKLGGSNVIAYPFYEYNDYSIEVLKEAGFTMAFAGESTYSDNLVHVGSNKYELPRFIMVNYTTKNDLDRYFNNIT